MAKQEEKSRYIANDSENLQRAIEKAEAEKAERERQAIEAQREAQRKIEEKFAKKP